ncbi:MAG: ATP synthase F1 subunit epsilon [Actinomycetota bacterium]|nr:ATP synthase F1 subunit epsilon [Actinomycetota bacterium]MDH5224319.1 ATP synthase F1 subunit epsilon [Actinomycetota bacterium]MDH5313832.1 ATP synthase F1 subunit epsilon [Actinomycetota bacterium]
MAFEVHVVTPEREVWAGVAETVIARGVDGEVGILTGHAPMMVQLAIGPLRIDREGDGELAAVVDGGFMHVTSSGGEDGQPATRVDVLAAQAELAGDIDVEAARVRSAELEQALQSHDTHLAEAEVASIKAELEKALARISLAG